MAVVLVIGARLEVSYWLNYQAPFCEGHGFYIVPLPASCYPIE